MLSNGKIFGFLTRKGIFFLKKIWIFFALSLLVQLGLLYVAVSDVKIPAAFIKILMLSAEAEGFRCTIGEVRLRNLTVLSAKEIRVDTLSGKEPLLRMSHAAVKFTPNFLFSGNKIPQFVSFEGIELYCPSVNSATGRSEQLFSSGSLLARRKRGVLTIESAKCRIGTTEVVIYGHVPGTRQFLLGKAVESSGTASSFSENLAVSFSRFLGVLSEALRPSLVRSLFESSAIIVELHPDDDVALADISVFCRSIDIADRIHLKRVLVNQKLAIIPSRKHIVPRGALWFSAEEAEGFWGNVFSNKVWIGAERIAMAAQLPDSTFLENVFLDERFPREVFFKAKSVHATTLEKGTIHLDNVSIVVAPWTRWDFPGDYDLKINGVLGASVASIAGAVFVDNENSSLNLRYDFLLDKNELLAFPQLRFIAKNEDIKALRFEERPRVRGNVNFSPGMKFKWANIELDSGETECGNVHLRALRVAGTVFPDAVHFSKIKAEGLDFSAKADVFSELSSFGDFRIRAWGTIDPVCLDGRLGWFWDRIWRDLKPAPSEQRPRADIDVYGNWSEKWEYVFGAIAGENCYGNGVLVDKVRLRVYEDPLLIAAFDMGFERGNDLAEGSLQWHYAMKPDYHYRDFRFLFRGSFPPKDVLQIIGEGLPEVLSELHTAGAGTAVVSGLFSGTPRYYPEKMLVNVKGNVPGAFSIFGIDGEDFNGEIFYDNGVVFVGNPFSARSGSGMLSGKIKVTLPESGQGADGSKVELDLNLKGVQRSHLMRAFSAIGDHVDRSEPTSSKSGAGAGAEIEKESSATDDNSSIDAVFAGAIIIPNLDSLAGAGRFLLREDDLFEFQVFGGISKLLSSVKIDLTTFMLNQAESSFVVRDRKIFLPDLRIFSTSGEINVRANIGLPNFDIDGEAVFRNLRGTKLPLLGKIVEWGSSSTKLLPVKISGTPENLNWAFSGFWSTMDDKKYGTAPENLKSDKEHFRNNDEEN